MSEKQLQNKIKRLNAEIEQLNKKVKHHKTFENSFRHEAGFLNERILEVMDENNRLKARISELEGEQDVK